MAAGKPETDSTEKADNGAGLHPTVWVTLLVGIVLAMVIGFALAA